MTAVLTVMAAVCPVVVQPRVSEEAKKLSAPFSDVFRSVEKIPGL
jgi:hypothetical protein